MIPKIFKHGNFLPTLKYVLGKEGALIIGTNMNSATPNELAREFSLAKRSNPEFKNACAHIILSIPHRSSEHLKGEYHEHLDDLQYGTVGQRFLEEMEYLGEGLQKSQYVMGRHTDREHEHIHIIASRIKMDATVVSDSWDYSRAEVAARKLEKEFGLEATPCSSEKVVQKLQEIGIEASVTSTLRKPQTIKQLKHTSGKPPVVELIADAVDEACSDKPTFTQLVSRLKEKNIIVHPKLDNQDNILGIAYEINDVKIAGYKIGKGYSFPGLQKYFGVVYGESGQQQATVVATFKRRRKRLTDAASIKRITASIEPIAAILNTVGGESSVDRESTSIDKVGDSQAIGGDANLVESTIDSEPINNQPDRSDSEDRTTTENQQPNIGQPSNSVKPTKGNRKNQRSDSKTREVVAEEVPVQDNAVGADIQLQGASGAASNDGRNIRSNSLDTDTDSTTTNIEPDKQSSEQYRNSIAEDRGETSEVNANSSKTYNIHWLIKLRTEPLFQNLVKETGSEAKAIYIIGEIIKQQGAITPDTTIQPEPTLQEVAPEKSNISARSAENPTLQQFSTQASDAAQQQQYANQVASVIRKYWELQGYKRKHYKSDRHELLLSNETYILKRTSGETIAIIPIDPNKPPQGKGLTNDEVKAFLDFEEKLKQLEMQQKTEKNQTPILGRQQQTFQRKPQAAHEGASHSPNRSDSGIDL
ncbi:MAG: relaxase/mobilization nuclease domain-containing protein [Tolypothrix carrinoi HA7290-LM1]|nr:relaxase/mobilization nuclease domain-containing protein [Tolypothrix carrinoi HA7290-LM1]